MGYIEQNPMMVFWLAIGVIAFFAEIWVPGVGLLFVGCGALTTGLLLNFSFISPDDTLLQIVIFFAATALWTLILWKPIQKFKLGKGKHSYNNIVGETATVSEKGLSKSRGGEVIWSGTIMKANLSKNSDVDNLDAGAQVVIEDIIGNRLIVTPKLET